MARVPLYKAAEAELIRRIESGDWEVGRRLPNEFVLAEEFGHFFERIFVRFVKLLWISCSTFKFIVSSNFRCIGRQHGRTV